MSKEQIQLNVTDGVHEVTILHGDAPDPINRSQIHNSELQITAPGDWLDMHSDASHVTSSSFAVFDTVAMRIDYHEDGRDPHGTIISGQLKPSREISDLGINSSQKFDCHKLSRHLKRYKLWAENHAHHMEVITRLEKARIKLNATMEKWKENDGKEKVDFFQVVEHDLIRDLQFNIPILHGEKKQKVNVEIVIESAAGGQVVLILESLEIDQMIDQAVEEAFDRERKRFIEGKVTVLNK